MSPSFFDRLQTSSHALGNSINANSMHVTIEIYILSLRSFISHKATLFGRVHVLIPQNKTSLLHFCTHTVISKLEHCTKSQWRYSHDHEHDYAIEAWSYPHLESLCDLTSQRHSSGALQGVYERPGFWFTVVETPQLFQFLAKIRICTNNPLSGQLLDKTTL